ncbi:MAG: WD40/YVTN/BNR-like repeat-containing protein [Planctomycetota bacterium]|jgi:photosystem II stability/assembly factor-like uncharacterized protein
MNTPRLLVAPVLFAVFCVAQAGPAQIGPAQVDASLLAGLKARSIGPAGMSGRITTIDGLIADPNIVYLGTASGGLFRTTNGGLTFTPLFDDEPVSSIGAVAVNQKNPDLIWVGTGEGNPRNSASPGNGIYKSADGGKTWQHLGLKDSERIHRICLHPTDADVAYAGVLGKAWGDGSERGVYKTTDGGKTWSRILYVNDKTGCSDLVMDPQNPDKLICGMWQFRRWPWFLKSGGPGSGLYVTHDGGKNWQRRAKDDGLPAGELGRIGVAIAASDPQIVYALVEAKKNALLKSTDGGRKFQTVNKDKNIAPRPFYYTDIRVDPKDPNRIYNLHTSVTYSEDGGKTFKRLMGWGTGIHPDHHAMWIHPQNPKLIWDGNDGGAAISTDRGKSWRFVKNLPLAQYYHLSVDSERPYNVYGGMQDNGSWRGPSTVWQSGGIRNYHWQELFFGDGFATLADPGNARIGYAMSQGGNLARWNLASSERKVIRPDGPEGTKLRFNWNAGIAIDPFDSKTIYYGSQFLHRSPDRGDTWEIISADLTTDNKAWQKQAESGGLTFDVTHAENFCSILAVAPSPVERGVIWVGTDDGRVHVTRDAGKSWQSVEQAIPGLPVNTWCPHIEASKFAAGTAYAVFDNHRRSDWTTYVYVTHDFGKTWTSLATADINGYVHCIEQDPVQENLLFVGTEFGLFVSHNGGRSWFQHKHGLPNGVAVRALIVHPRESDLVIGTFGRSAYVIDDIRPLRGLTTATLAAPFHMFEVAEAQQFRSAPTGASRFPGSDEFRGPVRPYGALLNVWIGVEDLDHPDPKKNKAKPKPAVVPAAMKTPPGKVPAKAVVPAVAETPAGKKPAGRKPSRKPNEVAIEIFDAANKRVRKFKRTVKRGLNRIAWPLSSDGPRLPQGSQSGRGGRGRSGPEVLPGTYRIVAKFRKHEATAEVQVVADPRIHIAFDQRLQKWQAIQDATRLVEAAGKVTARIEKTRADLQTIQKKLAPEDPEKPVPAREALLAEAKRLEKQLNAIDEKFRGPRNAQGIPPRRDSISSKVQSAYRALPSSWDAPTDAQRIRLRRAEVELQNGIDELNKLFAGPVAEFRAKIRAAKVELLPVADPIRIADK